MKSVVQRLRAAGVGDVRDDTTTRTLYSSDASLYRVSPLAVVFPRDAEEVAATLALSRDEGVPITARGGGTSLAGNAIGPGIVLDFSRHMNRVLTVDSQAREAVVEPGVIPAVLTRETARHGLRFGPDPSTHDRCTVGGMIGNNACGTRSLGYGRTSENVHAVEVITGAGEQLHLSGPADPASSPMLSAVHGTVQNGLATIRTEFGRFGRQVSGYPLEHLLPENTFDVGRMLIGSEGTLAVVTRATVRLVTEPAHRTLVVFGFADIVAAADATPAVLTLPGVTACEGLDGRIVEVVRTRGHRAVPDLPAGNAWLFVELTGDEPVAPAESKRLAVHCNAIEAAVVTDAAATSRLWRIRADGAGLSARNDAGMPAYAGWEDAAVPPARLGDYLRDFDTLLAEYGLTTAPYGHFGEGCLHARIDFPLDRPDGSHIYREFVYAAADLVAGYGGSLSGEHGDGRARSELLPRMYSRAAIALFEQIKHAFDPENLLNPGIMVAPRSVAADLRYPVSDRIGLALAFHDDGGDLSRAVHRCTGVGACRADHTGTSVMCPSYLATREEKDSTRGRARVLQDVIDGTLPGGWRAPAVREVLDLCLSCKGCVSDCPTGVDMASYKSEVLHQTYRHRLRPLSHYSLGLLPRWARLASHAPALANAVLRTPGLSALALAAAGIDGRRTVPRFAPHTFRSWFKTKPHRDGEPVLLFVDTFTDYFAPEVGIATVVVLEAAGFAPMLTEKSQCCALTWITTGQLDAARKVLGRTVDALASAAEKGIPIVGIEPSCTAVLRSDARELVNSAAAEAVAAAARTLAELVTERGWEPPALSGTTVVAQPHCHHHAVLGWEADAALLARAGVQVQQLGGCCGLAGNFGVERGHYEVSVAVAEQQLLPAVAAAGPETVILADGFSCRTQLTDLTDRSGLHLSELLADGLRKSSSPGN